MTRPADLPELLTVDEVADLLRISRRTLLNRRAAGLATPRGFRDGRRVLFRRDDVARYLDQRAAEDTIAARAAS